MSPALLRSEVCDGGKTPDGKRRARRYPLSRAVVWFGLPFLVFQSGCAIPPSVPTTETRERLGTVAIVPARYVPESNFITFAKGRLAGAGKGAARGAAAVLAVGVPATILTSGIAAGIIAFQTVLYSGLAAAPGAVAGAMEAVPREKAKEIEQAIANAIVHLEAQQMLARHLATVAEKEPIVHARTATVTGPAALEDHPSYGELKTADIDSVLEIAVVEIGFESCPHSYYSCPDAAKEQLVGLYVKSRARLVRVADGSELYARTFWYESRPRKFHDWAANGGQPLAEAFELGWRDLAGRIVDELFLIAPIRLPTPGIRATRSNPYAGHCWLRPIYPPLGESRVDSRRPQLRWEPFPRALDRQRGDRALVAKIRDVTYDLTIWETDGDALGQVVYERTGLPEPSHRVEAVLKPNSQYAWSFRARFVLDGRPMATRWAFAAFSGSWEFGPRDEQGAHMLEVCHSNQIMPWLYYRLTTPKD